MGPAVGVVGAALELVRQQRIEQLGERAGQVGRLEVAGEQDEGVRERVELGARAPGDGSQVVDERRQQRVVVGQAAAGLADQAQHPVDDDRLQGRLGGLAVDEPVRPVEVWTDLHECGDDPAGDGHRRTPHRVTRHDPDPSDVLVASYFRSVDDDLGPSEGCAPR